ncbi:PREDICTED: KRAB-A domain-containing protein 2-like [Vollenhovia emeryi]|uniref:KRAB-A domain-containing protein 2-like n=1 Tax=Vollenhovia emeryi TaxID=411798 RepID=UPI0005F4CC1F|nr:PREDICTED: KRAB-A domain-containing protein 2-like [Vollenhovia emeryi]
MAAVIHELVSIWPHCRIVHGRPRHPQSQGSVERSNADVENMLRAWMIDNDSTNWSRGCYEVQWQKNTSRHRVINRSPYEALLGPIKNSIRNTYLPDEILNSLKTEEDLEQALEEQNVQLNASDLNFSVQQCEDVGKTKRVREDEEEEGEGTHRRSER